MNRRKGILKRVLSFVIIFSMLIPVMDIPVFAVSTDGSPKGKTGETLTTTNELHEWVVQAIWSETKEQSLVKHETEWKSVGVKLTFSFFLNGAKRTYQENEVKFTVKGISDIGRSGPTPRAQTTTTQSNSDWTLQYDESKDEYTFIYRHSIPKQQEMSGGFQMQWNFDSRAAWNGYKYSSNPVFTVGEESINMPIMTLDYESKRDLYGIKVYSEQLTASELESVQTKFEDDYPTAEGEAPKDYLWYKYNNLLSRQTYARGINKWSYFVALDIEKNEEYVSDPENEYTEMSLDDVKIYRWIYDYNEGRNVLRETQITQIEDPATGQQVYGFWMYKDVYGDPATSPYQFILGMDKDKIPGNYVNLHTRLIPLFNDETEYILDDENYLQTEGGRLTADVTCTTDNYWFIYDHYDFWHRKTLANQGVRLVNGFYSGRTERFVLEGSTNRGYSKSGSEAPEGSGEGDPYDDPNYVQRVYPDISEKFSFIQGDDKVFVKTRAGKMRELEDDEYNFSTVYLRRNTSYADYNFKIYVAYEKGLPFNEYELFYSGTTLDTERGYVRFPEGVKAFYVEVQDVVGTYYCAVDVEVEFNFDWEKEKDKQEADQINPDGGITNVSYMRLVKANGHNFAGMSLNHYGGAFKTLIAPFDRSVYGEYLYREYEDIVIRSPQTYISSGTYIHAFEKESRSIRYNSYINTTGAISADEEGPLKKFSLYTVIPQNVLFNKDLDDITILVDRDHPLKGTGVDGFILDTDDFKEHVSYSVKKDSIGRDVIVADFDFTDMPIEIQTGTNITLQIPVYITVADYAADITAVYTAESFTAIHDNGIEKISGNIQVDLTDIDGDGDRTEIVAHSYSSTRFSVLLKEWIEASQKFVKTEYSGSFVPGEPEEQVRADYKTSIESENKESYYSYRLDFDIGDNPIKDIVFYDAIEPKNVNVYYNSEDTKAVDSKWQGTLISVDVSNLIDAGFRGSEVYYMEEQLDLEQEGFKDLHVLESTQYTWKKMTTDNEKKIWKPVDGDTVRTIAVKLPPDEKEELDCMVSVTVNMQTPMKTDTIIDNTAAQNYFTVTCTQRQAATSTYRNSEYKSAITNVYIQQTTPIINIKKIDKINKAALPGAVFGVYYDEACTEPVKDVEKGIDLTEITTNNMGIAKAVVPAIGKYYIKEIKAPDAYKLNSEVKEVIAKKNTENVAIEFADDRATGSVTLLKKDIDDKAIENIAGAKFELYTSNDEKVYTDANYNYSTDSSGTNAVFVTGNNGFTIKELPWGNYYFKEIEAPKGYALNENKTPFSIRKRGAEDGEIKVNVEHYDEELTATLRIIKTDAEDDKLYLRGARYNVEKKVGEDWVAVRNNVVTNTVGELTVEGLKFGEYRFKEIIAPRGYEVSNQTNPKTVTLTAETVGQTFEVRQSDTKKTGSVQLKKISNTGIPISGAVFSLYRINGVRDDGKNRPNGDATDDLIKSNIKTDHEGQTPVIDELDWGNYYFVETKAAKGYSKNDVKYTSEQITITPENVDITQEITATNKQIPGTVTLTKYKSEDRLKDDKKPLAGAMFSLYDKDDNLIAAGLHRGVYNAETGVTTEGNEPGVLTVTNLPWGSYYFKETKAPDGYTVSDVIRFAVNAQNCMSEQQLECYDDPITCEITIEKEIDETLPQFGNPTFIFKITNVETNKTWTESLTLNENKKSDTVKINVETGEYTVEEIAVSRYKLYNMRVAAGGDNTLDQNVKVTIDEQESKFRFTLDASGDRGDSVHLIFENHLETYDKDNHVTAARNIIPIEKKITGISVEYLKDYIPLNSNAEESEYTINKTEDLQLVLIYDDGSTVEVDPSEFGALLPKGGNGEFKVPNGVNDESSEFSIDAQFTTDGKTYYTTFFVTVEPAVVKPTQKVIYMVDENNESYFDKDGKHPTANVVTYVGGEVKKGEYVEVIPVADDLLFECWKDKKGQVFKTEEEVIAYLNENTETSTLYLTAIVVQIQLVTDFNYTGNYQEYEVKATGKYLLETWGAYGGGLDSNISQTMGAGAYAYGYVNLKKGTKLYVYVGNHPTDPHGGWNGGGEVRNTVQPQNNTSRLLYAGGGATDISLQSGTWDSASHLYSRILVAGGGGGANTWNEGGRVYPDKGGNAGYASNNWSGIKGGGGDYGSPGTLSNGGDTSSANCCSVAVNGSFGNGGSVWWVNEVIGAGGGGWYGGGAGGGAANNGAGGGGSSYAWSSEGNLFSYYPNNYPDYKPSSDYFLTNVGSELRTDTDNLDGRARISFVSLNN